ncbi:MAG: HAMP domain-containing histidine kinase [Spirochaeta sp.]|nr:HAMP domain-containing histidine kinase [Spirochaeta sp.]
MLDSFVQFSEHEHENEHEKLLRFLYLAPVALLEIDVGGDIHLMNGYASGYLMPLSKTGSLTNLFDLLLETGIDLPELVASYAAESGTIIKDRRLRYDSAGASPVYFSLTVERLSADRYMVAMSDITIQVRQEERISTMIEQEALHRGRAEIAAGVLHDIGNAITGVGTGVNRLLGETVWPEEDGLSRLELMFQDVYESLCGALGVAKTDALLRYTSELQATLRARRAELNEHLESTAKTVAHISEVLALQRQYVGNKRDQTHTVIPLVQLVEDSISMQNAALEKRRISIRRQYNDASASVAGSRTDLIRVCVNMLRNAFDSFDRTEMHAEPVVLLETSRSPDKTRVVLSMSDNGGGFAADPQELFALGVSRKKNSDGMGLFACRKIIESHNGRLWLASDGPGKGAVAHIELPIQEEQGT